MFAFETLPARGDFGMPRPCAWPQPPRPRPARRPGASPYALAANAAPNRLKAANPNALGMLHKWFGQDSVHSRQKLWVYSFSQERLGAVQPNFTVVRSGT